MIRLFLPAIILGGLALPQASAQERSAPELAREKVRKWVQTKELISRESSAWEEGKQMLTDLIALREHEAGEMEAVIEHARERVDAIEKESDSLEKEERERHLWREEFERKVTRIENGLIPQLAFLPPPVKEKLAAPLARLEDRGDDAELQHRFRDILAILNECLSFNSQIHSVPELREIGGVRIEVDVLYLGMSQAWYADREGKIGGTGIPTKDGWRWEENPAIAPKIRRAIAIHNKNEAPGFVRLPVLHGDGKK